VDIDGALSAVTDFTLGGDSQLSSTTTANSATIAHTNTSMVFSDALVTINGELRLPNNVGAANPKQPL